MPDFARMIDELQYSLIALIAGIHWSLQEALLMAGYTVKLVNVWLIENAFMPIIAQTNNSLGIAVSVVFVVALLVLGITYLLAVFIGSMWKEEVFRTSGTRELKAGEAFRSDAACAEIVRLDIVASHAIPPAIRHGTSNGRKRMIVLKPAIRGVAWPSCSLIRTAR